MAAAVVLAAPGVGWRILLPDGRFNSKSKTKSDPVSDWLNACTAIVFVPSTRNVAALEIVTSYQIPSVALLDALVEMVGSVVGMLRWATKTPLIQTKMPSSWVWRSVRLGVISPGSITNVFLAKMDR